MTRIEQHKIILELRNYVKKMSRDEKYDFEMMLKRNRDDEDLDSIARAKLQTMDEKYIPKHSKSELEEKWKKLTGGKP
jgi:hypothetical protein